MSSQVPWAKTVIVTIPDGETESPVINIASAVKGTIFSPTGGAAITVSLQTAITNPPYDASAVVTSWQTPVDDADVEVGPYSLAAGEFDLLPDDVFKGSVLKLIASAAVTGDTQVGIFLKGA